MEVVLETNAIHEISVSMKIQGRDHACVAEQVCFNVNDLLD